MYTKNIAINIDPGHAQRHHTDVLTGIINMPSGRLAGLHGSIILMTGWTAMTE